MSHVVASAIEAAFESGDDEHHQSRHRGVKALAAGAALVAAARVVAPKVSKFDALTTLGKVTRIPDAVRGVPDRVRDRLADSGLFEDEDFDDDEYDEPESDADVDEDEDEEEEPEA